MTESGVWDAASSSERYVLVVDSDSQNLLFMSMILERFRYRAYSALGVGSALEVAYSTSPSLVLTELHLKGLNGFDLLHRLRENPGTSTVPVIVMCREMTDELKQQSMREGASGFLEKPIQVNALYESIQPIMEPSCRRKHLRIQTRLSVTVNDRPLDCIDGECATNLSVKGLHLRTIQPYPVNSTVLIGAILNDQEIEAEARVAYCERPDAEPSMWAVGLQFLQTSFQTAEVIRKFINDEASHGMVP